MSMKKSFDLELKKISGLTWLPWIGEQYENNEQRILLVGESHYTKPDEKLSIEQAKELLLRDENFTREVIKECPIEKLWRNNMFDNLHRTFFLNNDFETTLFWKNVAFYNFVQRPMDYSYKERPTEDDFLRGWEIFNEIINILKPSAYLFIGVGASNFFHKAKNKYNIIGSDVQWLDGQGAYGRKFEIENGSIKIPIVAIRHTASYFDYNSWHSFLMKYFKKELVFLANKSDMLSTLIYQDKIDNPFINKDMWVDEVPIRNHKPIIACPYETIDQYGDAKFISVGRAQYGNDDDATVKIWRWAENGDRWSRQSEEIPISRVADMCLMLLSTIKRLQSNDDEHPYTYLGERMIKEDLVFLDKQLHRDEVNEHLKKSIRELKKLINSIDIDKL